MDVIVRAPLMQEKIKGLLDGGEFSGVSLSFTEKKGIELVFHASGENIASLDVASIIKSAVKATDFGKGIMLSVIIK